MVEQDKPTETNFGTLVKVVNEIVKEKEPAIFNSYLYQNTGFVWYAVTHAMDKSRQEARRDIANALVEYCTAEDNRADIAKTIFKRYSTEEERTTPIDDKGNVYCADLDLTINPGEIYDFSMEHENFIGAKIVAKEFGLGKEKVHAARIAYVEQKIDAGDDLGINSLGIYYRDVKELGVLDSPLGQEVARLWYDCLMNYGQTFLQKGWPVRDKFKRAKQVAIEANLGQELVDRADKANPGILTRIYSATVSRTISGVKGILGMEE
jgi:hypothetical protein